MFNRMKKAKMRMMINSLLVIITQIEEMKTMAMLLPS